MIWNVLDFFHQNITIEPNSRFNNNNEEPTMKIVENWTIEFDVEKNLFSVDFGGKLSINWTEKKVVESFLQWRMRKMIDNDI